jgi:ribosome maturation protein SDO1
MANLLANMCVNTETQRPFPLAVIEKAMIDYHFLLKPNKSAKQKVNLLFVYYDQYFTFFFAF